MNKDTSDNLTDAIIKLMGVVDYNGIRETSKSINSIEYPDIANICAIDMADDDLPTPPFSLIKLIIWLIIFLLSIYYRFIIQYFWIKSMFNNVFFHIFSIYE